MAKSSKQHKAKSRRNNSKQSTSTASLRIIAGEWRSRLIDFAPEQGLRPTPNRVRETLFNWLMPVIEGADCLDLFAGSGALSFEALSRGARQAVMVDASSAVCTCLNQQLAKLHCNKASVYQRTAQQWLSEQANKAVFDIVFLDPPFDKGLIPIITKTLDESGLLKPLAYVYIESEHTLSDDDLPGHWQLHKQKCTGEVYYQLYQA